MVSSYSRPNFQSTWKCVILHMRRRCSLWLKVSSLKTTCTHMYLLIDCKITLLSFCDCYKSEPLVKYVIFFGCFEILGQSKFSKFSHCSDFSNEKRGFGKIKSFSKNWSNTYFHTIVICLSFWCLHVFCSFTLSVSVIFVVHKKD